MNKKAVLIIFPILLVVLGAGLAFGLRALTGRGSAKLENGQTYNVWVIEAEVADHPSRGGAWDLDGSAPDLMAVLRFRGNTVLKTNVAKDSLIARWEPLGLNWKDLV